MATQSRRGCSPQETPLPLKGGPVSCLLLSRERNSFSFSAAPLTEYYKICCGILARGCISASGFESNLQVMLSLISMPYPGEFNQNCFYQLASSFGRGRAN